MEKHLEKIRYLENELAVRDDEVRKAAYYGTQLLQENGDLKTRIENLKQDKYSLQFKLETKSKFMDSQVTEIESQKETINAYEKEQEFLKREHGAMSKRLQEKVLENQEIRKTSEELVLANTSLKKQVLDLEAELENYRNQVQMSLNETNSEECLKLSLELQKCQEEKATLLSLVSESEHKLEKLKNVEEKYISLIESLRQTLNEKNSEVQSYLTIIEKAKEENVELMGQIEMLKLEQVDVSRRGNSVFGEVEDRRKAVEKELIILRRKHECLKENYDIRLVEMRKLKYQMDIFLGMFSQKVDYNYMEDLETKLCGAQKEIEYLTKRLTDQIKSQDSHLSSTFVEQIGSLDDSYGYLRALLMQSRKKIEELEKELQDQRLLKFAGNDELIETKRLLYHSNKNFENLKGETLRLKLKLQDLMMAPGDEKEPEPKREIIPGFQPLDEPKNESQNASTDKLKGRRRRRMTSSYNREKENSNPCYDLFSALKNPVLASEKKQQGKKVLFSKTDEIIGNNSSNVESENELLAAPIIHMNDGNYGCTQQ